MYKISEKSCCNLEKMLKIRKMLDFLSKSWYTKLSTQRVRVLKFQKVCESHECTEAENIGCRGGRIRQNR